MWTAISVALVAVAGFAAFVVMLGSRKVREAVTDGRLLANQVKVEQIPELLEEGLSVLQRQFGVTLDLSNRDEAARSFDRIMFEKKFDVRYAFGRPGHPGWFVLPLGAIFGELIRMHSDGEWVVDVEHGLVVRLKISDQILTIRPFTEIIDHHAKWHGVGALEAKIQVATRKMDWVFNNQSG